MFRNLKKITHSTKGGAEQLLNRPYVPEWDIVRGLTQPTNPGYSAQIRCKERLVDNFLVR